MSKRTETVFWFSVLAHHAGRPLKRLEFPVCNVRVALDPTAAIWEHQLQPSLPLPPAELDRGHASLTSASHADLTGSGFRLDQVLRRCSPSIDRCSNRTDQTEARLPVKSTLCRGPATTRMDQNRTITGGVPSRRQTSENRKRTDYDVLWLYSSGNALSSSVLRDGASFAADGQILNCTPAAADRVAVQSRQRSHPHR